MDTLTRRQAAWLRSTIDANPFPFTENVNVDDLTVDQATMLMDRVFGSTVTPDDGPIEAGPPFTTDDTALTLGVHVAYHEVLLRNMGQRRIWAMMTGQDTAPFDRGVDYHRRTIDTLNAVACTQDVIPLVSTSLRMALAEARATGYPDWLDVGARDYVEHGRRAPVVAGSTVDDDRDAEHDKVGVSQGPPADRETPVANATPEPAPDLLDDIDAPVPYVLAEAE